VHWVQQREDDEWSAGWLVVVPVVSGYLGSGVPGSLVGVVTDG
jgi:hypothetical protein